MRKLFVFTLSSLFGILFASLAFASTPTLSVNAPLSPVDANKATISGKTSAGASVTVTGGTYNIPPTTADSQGNFSIEVALIQESINSFDVKAEKNGEFSQTRHITIEEGVAVTQAYESSTGQDRTAPDKPTVEENNVVTDETTYKIIGNAEANSSIVVTGSASKTVSVDSSGHFEISVNLSGGGTKDSFTLTAKDASNNVSIGLKVYVTGNGTSNAQTDTSTEDTSIETNSANKTASFTDTESHWGKEYIERLYELGAVSGYSDGSFGPDKEITRAEILKITLQVFNHDTASASNTGVFTDIGSKDWFANYVGYANIKGIVSGYSDSTFKPNNNVSRAAALKIIILAAGITNPTGSTNFSDVKSEDWFNAYTAWAKENEIIGGYEDGSFKPGQNITRAEASKIILEVLDFVNAQAPQ